MVVGEATNRGEVREVEEGPPPSGDEGRAGEEERSREGFEGWVLALVLGKEITAAGFGLDSDEEFERGGGRGIRWVAGEVEEEVGLDFDPPPTRCFLGLGLK